MPKLSEFVLGVYFAVAVGLVIFAIQSNMTPSALYDLSDNAIALFWFVIGLAFVIIAAIQGWRRIREKRDETAEAKRGFRATRTARPAIH